MVPQDVTLGMAKDPSSSGFLFSEKEILSFRVLHINQLKNPLGPWIELRNSLLLESNHLFSSVRVPLTVLALYKSFKCFFSSLKDKSSV